MASKDEIRRVSIFINGTDADLTLKQLQASSKKLSNELAKLPIGSDEFKAKALQLQQVNKVLNDIKDDVKGVGDSFDQLKGSVQSALGALGLGIGISQAISFTKEMIKLEGTIEGVQNAFSKIGDTTGALDKLRAASRGLVSDLDLEKVAVKANNANIPIDKMGILLQFAQQRARDTGQDVTELTDKIVTGIGKNSPKALAGLGVSVKEVKDEFKLTGDMVTAVSNIIEREMIKGGKDVDTFGDRIDQINIKLENSKGKVAKWFASFLGYNDIADQDIVTDLSNKNIKALGDYQKKTDAELDKLIQAQEAKVKQAKGDYDLSQKELNQYKDEHPVKYSLKSDEAKSLDSFSKYNSEQYQSERNALAALNKEKEKRTVKKEDDDNADAKEETQKEKIERLKNEYLQSSKELTEKYKEFNAAQLADDQEKNDKELLASANKYNKMIADEQSFLDKSKTNKYANAAEVQKHQDQIVALNKSKVDEANKIRERQEQELTQKLQAFRDQLNGRVQTEQDKELTQINAFYDEQAKAAGNNEELQAQIAADRLAAIDDLKLRTEKKLQDDIAKIKSESAVADADRDTVELARINKKYDDQVTALKAKYTKEEQATQAFQDAIALIEKNRKGETKAYNDDKDKKASQQNIDFAVKEAQTISNSIFTISNRSRQADTDAKIKNLEDQKTAELANTSLTADQRQAITDKYNKQEGDLKLQAWKADQAAAEEQAVINGALAVVKALAQVGPLGSAFVIPGIIAETLAQELIISSQPQPNFYADGGYSAIDSTSPSGWVKRPTLFTNSSSGKPFVAGEGYKSEYIVSSEQLKDPVVANFVGMMEGIRGVRKFEQGGFSSSTAGSKPTFKITTGSNASATSPDKTHELLGQIRDAFTDWSKKPWSFNNRAYNQYTQNIANSKTRADA